MALVFCLFCISTFLLIGECVLFVVLGLVFCPYQANRLAWGKRLRNDLFFVEWDVNPQLNQSIMHNQ